MTVRGPALREGRAPVRDRLTAMLFLAALAHAVVILGVGFSSSPLRSPTDAPPLDVLLVSDELPDSRANPNAAYLAQRTQAGSGNTDERRPASTPASRGRTAAAEQPTADDTAAQDAEHRPGASGALALNSVSGTTLLYVGDEPAAAAAQSLPPGELPGEPRAGRGDAELLLRGRRNGERWIAPDTRASQLAPYLVAWKHKVERLGTLNFPAIAQARSALAPIVEVEIDADGRLRAAHVRRSSGDGALDQAALSILRLASPFEPFPPRMAAQYLRLRFAYEWDFVSGNGSPGETASPADPPPLGPNPRPVTPSSDGASGP